MRTVDCIVIGAGPAGAFCAAKLASQGMQCVALEKRNPMTGKVCGGGISRYGVRVLEKAGFPIDQLLQNGVKIERDIRIRDGQAIMHTHWEEEPFEASFAVGIHRDILENLFLQYAIRHGVTVRLGCQVSRIERNNSLFYVDDYCAPNVVQACGAVNGLTPCKELPAGISAVCKSEYGPAHSFVFDYSEPYAGGYAWIFHIGLNLWNVGVWSRNPGVKLKALFQQHERTCLRKYLGGNVVYAQSPSGALIGAGGKMPRHEDGMYFCGDTARTASISNGEGIPQAVLSGIHTAENILADWRNC